MATSCIAAHAVALEKFTAKRWMCLIVGTAAQEWMVNRMRLIDADVLVANLEDDAAHMEDNIAIMFTYAAINDIKHAETIDAQPVRHGRWETDGMLMDDGEYLMTRCTVCGTAYEYGHNENYCGYCGARMDGCKEGETNEQ